VTGVRTARVVAAAVIVVAGLSLVAVAARSGRTATLTPVTTPSAAGPQVTLTATPTLSPTPSPSPRKPGNWAVPGTIFIVLMVLGVAYVLGFSAWLARWSRRGRRHWWIPGRWRRRPPEPESDRPVAQALAGAADAGLRRIDEGGAADAVVACWVLLEQAAADAGVRRRPAETPTELTERVLAGYAVSAVVLGELADLYREARYSGHRLGEPERDRARAALTVVRAELAGPVRRPP
jgi:hypothetical protein